MKTNKFAVIGIGRFGMAIAKALSKSGAEVLAIDANPDVIEAISEDVALAVICEATDRKALNAQNITEFDAVVVAIGNNFEELLLCCVILIDMGIKRIIARSEGANQASILRKIGISEILSPEAEVGIIVAEKLLNPSIVSYLQLPDDYRIAEVMAPNKFIGRNLTDISLREKYRLNIITIKREFVHKNGEEKKTTIHITGVPEGNTCVEKYDTLIIFGKTGDIERMIEINS